MRLGILYLGKKLGDSEDKPSTQMRDRPISSPCPWDTDPLKREPQKVIRHSLHPPLTTTHHMNKLPVIMTVDYRYKI